MKKVLLLFVAASLLTACGLDKKDPKAVTEAFVTAFSNQDWDAAKELSTKESHEMIDGIKGMMAMAPKDEKAAPIKIKSIECKEDGDNCTCDVTYEDEKSAEKMGKTYNLKKVDGNWMVDFKKDTGMEGMDMEGMDMDMEGMDMDMEGIDMEGMDMEGMDMEMEEPMDVPAIEEEM
jgi:hypothetical protein